MGQRRDELDHIIRSVCSEFGIRKSDLISRSLDARHVHARGILALIVRENSDLTLAEAARRLRRDRSGLSSAAKRMSRHVEEDEDLAERLQKIRDDLAESFSEKTGGYSTLRDRIRTQGIHSLAEAVSIICSLTDSLSCYDSSDLPKYVIPERVVLTDDSNCRLLDLSELTSFDRDKRNLEIYVAPEIRGGGEPTYTSVVWSLGILLSELLCGHIPCLENDDDTISEIAECTSDLPESVIVLLSQAIDSDPDLRIQNPGIFGRELSAILKGIDQSPQSLQAQIQEIFESREVISSTPESAEEKQTKIRNNCDLTFVGREREIGELRTHLSDPQRRIVSIVGPGGVGKSRLAYELAGRVTEEYEDGVYFIPLNPIHSPAFISLAIGNAIGLSFGGSHDPLDQLIAHLRSKKILLVLDDFDRLITGADQVARLIGETENIRVLVTSRTILDLQDERIYEVQGLEVPEDNDSRSLLDFSSVQLFLENATRLRREFELINQDSGIIARICRLLEGVPLAIELASGWIRVLTPGEILDEILNGIDVLKTSERGRAERHQSMRATFDRSWRMLEDREQRVLSGLSVFKGGFSRDAAVSVADTSVDVLKSLVNTSLVQIDIFGRYRIHELLRQYAEEKLIEDVERQSTTKRAHARYYGVILKKLNALLRSKQMATALEAIEQEWSNIDSGFMWSIQHDDIEEITVYIQPLSDYLQSKSRFLDGEYLLSEALRLLMERFSAQKYKSDLSIKLLIARLKARLALQKGRLGKYTDSESIIKESLPVFEAIDQDEDMYFCISILANIANKQGRYHDALDLWKSILNRAESGDSTRKAKIMSSMASVYGWLGEQNQARVYFKRACSILRNQDKPIPLAQSLNGLGDLALRQGRYKEAREYYERVLTIVRELGHEGLLHVTIDRLAGCAINMGEYQKAKKLYEEVLELYRKTGSESATARGLYALGNCLNFLSDFDRARDLLEDSVDLYRRIGEIPGEAFSLNALGLVYQNLNRWQVASECHDRALFLFTDISNAEGRIATFMLLARCYLELGKPASARSNFHQAIELCRKHTYKSRLMDLLLEISVFFKRENKIRDALVLKIFISSYEKGESIPITRIEEALGSLSISQEEEESIRREVSGITISDILDFVVQRL